MGIGDYLAGLRAAREVCQKYADGIERGMEYGRESWRTAALGEFKDAIAEIDDLMKAAPQSVTEQIGSITLTMTPIPEWVQKAIAENLKRANP